MRALALFGCTVFGIGCSSTTAMNLTIQLGSDVAARTAELATLELQVGGELTPFDRTIAIAGKFGSGSETLQYLPGIGSGVLTFTVTLADASGAPIGRGSKSGSVKSHGSSPLSIVVGGTGGDLGGMADMASTDLAGGSNVDMAQPCALLQVSTLSGTGAAGYVDGAGNIAQFTTLEGITVDAAGTLRVAEAAHVRKILADGTTSTFSSGGSPTFLLARRLAGTNAGTFEVVDSTNDALEHISSTGTPQGAALLLGGIITVGNNFSSGSTYVWDMQTANISVVNGSNMAVHFSGNGSGFMDGSAATAKFANVVDLTFDSAGTMWVADAGNFRVRKVLADGSVTSIAGSTMGHTDGNGSAAQFGAIGGITVDNASHLLYVTDGTTIRTVTPAGGVTTLVGSTAGFVDGTGCVAKFGALKGIAYFAGSLYAVDIERVRKIVLP